MKRVYALIAVLLSISMFGACAASVSNPIKSEIPTASSTPSPSPKPTPSPTPTPKNDLSAEQIFQLLKDNGLPIEHAITFDEKTDQNKLLGRPGEYITKAAFVDGRYLDDWKLLSEDKDFDPLTFNYGNTVETFASKSDMQKRYDYVKAIIDTGGMFSQYIYNTDKAILRLSYDITPTEVKEYEKVFLDIAK